MTFSVVPVHPLLHYPIITYGLLHLFGLHPNVGYHDRHAVASNGVLEDVGELGLPVRDVVAVTVHQSQSHLLQE